MIYIIGKRSNLSKALSLILENSILVSTEDVINKKIELQKDSVVILNNFQQAVRLNDLSYPSEYVNSSILSTAKLLELAQKNKPAKIVYTSSASVYGNNIYCRESDQLEPRSLHAALKVANEKLIEQFCKNSNIDLTITRVFNMYGRDDSFSVISKLIGCIKNNDEFILINNGNAIRDFIHIDDVAFAYSKIIKLSNLPYLNIASGQGTSIRQMIDFLVFKEVTLKTKVIYKEDELKTSTASTELLSSIVDVEKFKNVYEYLNEVLL